MGVDLIISSLFVMSFKTVGFETRATVCQSREVAVMGRKSRLRRWKQIAYLDPHGQITQIFDLDRSGRLVHQMIHPRKKLVLEDYLCVGDGRDCSNCAISTAMFPTRDQGPDIIPAFGVFGNLSEASAAGDAFFNPFADEGIEDGGALASFFMYGDWLDAGQCAGVSLQEAAGRQKK
jgi:hypothetical protein